MTDRQIDRTGKRALFSDPVDAAAEPTAVAPDAGGRGALFSTPPRRAGTVIIECSDCKVRSRVPLTGLALRLASGSAWIPLGRYQNWVRCPSCGRRRWCRIGWLE